MPVPSVKTLVIGDESACEMHEVVADIRQLAPHEIRTASNLDAVRRLVREEAWHPALIVVLETWSEQSDFEPVDSEPQWDGTVIRRYRESIISERLRFIRLKLGSSGS